VTDWMNLFAVYREVVIRENEVVQGLLHPELRPDDPSVEAALRSWQGTHFLNHTPAGVELTLVRRRAVPRRERWWLHGLLGLLTLLTTTIAGAYFVGRPPLEFVLLPLGPWRMPLPVHLSPGDLAPGLIFSLPLLAILFGHEMGHYVMARRHQMDVSPPYFIPSPNWINLIGTFGAFIRLRSPIINRPMLLDVGVAGPLMSFALSLPALALGLGWSQPVSLQSAPSPSEYVVLWGAQPIWLGDSLVMRLFSSVFAPEAGAILLHPLAFAGWLGLFVTTLNLFPLSQLDGGHILYALLGPAQRYVGLAFLVVLLLLGQWWWGWWFWAVVILLLGRGTIRHPAVFDPTLDVDRRRGWFGWACVVIFVITFVPIPLQG
jgi:hypothetical protein